MKSLDFSNKTLRKQLRRRDALQDSHRRKEQRQQTVRQLDYTFDLDHLTTDGFPRVMAPPDGCTQLSGGLVKMQFYALKNGEKRELLNISISTNNNSAFH